MYLRVLLCLSFVLLGVSCTSVLNVDTSIKELSIKYSALTTDDLNCLEEYDPIYNKQTIWGNIKDKILSAWNNLLQSAKTTKKNISDWFAKVKSRADEILAEAKKNINEKALEVREKLKEITSKAKEVGVDVKECVAEREEEIKQIIMMAVAKLTNCVINKVGEAEDVANKIQNIIESAVDIKNLINNRLDTCKNQSIAVPKCLTAIAGQIVKESSKLSKAIIATASSVKNIIGDIQSALPACAAENALDVSMKFTKLMIEVATCVKRKMEDATQIDYKLVHLLN